MVKRGMEDIKKTQIKSLEVKTTLPEISNRSDATEEKISKLEGDKRNSPK